MIFNDFRVLRDISFGYEFIYSGNYTYPNHRSSLTTYDRRTCLVVPVLLEGEALIKDYKFIL